MARAGPPCRRSGYRRCRKTSRSTTPPRQCGARGLPAHAHAVRDRSRSAGGYTATAIQSIDQSRAWAHWQHVFTRTRQAKQAPLTPLEIANPSDGIGYLVNSPRSSFQCDPGNAFARFLPLASVLNSVRDRDFGPTPAAVSLQTGNSNGAIPSWWNAMLCPSRPSSYSMLPLRVGQPDGMPRRRVYTLAPARRAARTVYACGSPKNRGEPKTTSADSAEIGATRGHEDGIMLPVGVHDDHDVRARASSPYWSGRAAPAPRFMQSIARPRPRPPAASAVPSPEPGRPRRRPRPPSVG